MKDKDAKTVKAVKHWLTRWADSNELTPRIMSNVTNRSLSTCNRWLQDDNKSCPNAIDFWLIMNYLGEHRVCLEPCCELCCLLKVHPPEVYNGLLTAFSGTEPSCAPKEIQS